MTIKCIYQKYPMVPINIQETNHISIIVIKVHLKLEKWIPKINFLLLCNYIYWRSFLPLGGWISELDLFHHELQHPQCSDQVCISYFPVRCCLPTLENSIELSKNKRSNINHSSLIYGFFFFQKGLNIFIFIKDIIFIYLYKKNSVVLRPKHYTKFFFFLPPPLAISQVHTYI